MIHHILHHPRLTLPQLQTKDRPSSARRDAVSLTRAVPRSFRGDSGNYFPSVFSEEKICRNPSPERFQRGKKLPASLTLAALPVFVAIALSSCNRFDPVERVFPNSLYLDVSAMEETHPSNFNSRTQTAS